MKSQLGEETDDDTYYDDPIKLFDSEENAIYFGSLPSRYDIAAENVTGETEKSKNEEFCRVIEKSIKTLSVGELSETSDNSEIDIRKLSVKLVDCGKHPWYFRKYTQQILNKTKNKVGSDSESEVDECDPDDCYIVEDLQDVLNKNISYQPKKYPVNILHIIKDSTKKSLEEIRRREDCKIDFKRNKGLIGMKIKQKNIPLTSENNVEINLKPKNSEKKLKDIGYNDPYITAADRILSYVGTELIPIPENTDDFCSSLDKSTEDKAKKIGDLEVKSVVEKTAKRNVPVQFNSETMSSKIVNDIKEKKICNILPEAKFKYTKLNKNLFKNKTIHERHPKSKLNTTNVLKKSPKHVKDVKITNKYKNSQENILNAAKTGFIKFMPKSNQLDTKIIKDSKHMIHEVKDADQTTSIMTKKIHKIADKHKLEPKSPILPCNTLIKKPKLIHDVNSNSSIPEKPRNISKKANNLIKILNGLRNVCNSRNTHNNKLVNEVSSEVDTGPKLSDEIPKDSPKDSCVLQDKATEEINDICSLSLAVSAIDKTCNNLNKTNFNNPVTRPTTSNVNNKVSIAQNLNKVCQDKVNELSVINDASIANNDSSNIPKKSKVSDKAVPTTILITPSNDTKPCLQDSNQPQISAQKTLSSKMSQDNVCCNNDNVTVHNRYASAIILKPSHQINLKDTGHQLECSVQSNAPQKPSNLHIPVLAQSQYRPYQNTHNSYYQSAPSGSHPHHVSRSVNSSAPKRFPLVYQTSTPFNYKGWQSQNIAPLQLSASVTLSANTISNVIQASNSSYVNRPYYPPVSVRQQQPCISYSKIVSNSQSKDSSIIGRNNSGVVKKINITAVPQSKDVNSKDKVVEVVREVAVEGSRNAENGADEILEIVATKTEMLEELDKLVYDVDDSSSLKTTNESPYEMKKVVTFEKEIVPKKPEKVNEKKYDAKVEQSKGYSPPILPIPTYQKILDAVVLDSRILNGKSKVNTHTKDLQSNFNDKSKPVQKRDNHKFCKRKLAHQISKPGTSVGKADAKKISLEEYKKRILIKTSRSERSHKKMHGDKYSSSGKRPHVEYKYNVDRHSAESDLGYDSDSTVVL